MTLDIIAFTLAALYLAAAFAMLTIGVIGFLNPPVATRCRRCSQWMTDLRRGPAPICLRCRLHPASPSTRQPAPHG
ncbi:hypothetical protein VMT65_09425 [Nocardia sp. CDC153]|uniref:hypothetical protein n=1 Tax=Nocardia sp. CDC153 TaxID=3112167 RepID=UPI002DB86B18|nr:hypothetical protein [Nocardia sp. CDC153]MEC3953247.1 hypothetical protein [Nocardia sp. CDC153]